MLIASILMVFIAILPILLGAMTYKTLGNSNLSFAIILYMFFVAVWQLDVAFLFMKDLLSQDVIEWWFKILRFGQMFLIPTFLYVFYSFSKTSTTERKIFHKWHLYVMFGWVIITYLINLTDFGVQGLVLTHFGSYKPVYGAGNISYSIYLIFSFVVLYMGHLEMRLREHDVSVKNFMKKFYNHCVLLMLLGVLNFVDIFYLLSGTLGIIIFTTLITFALIRYNFDEIEKLNKLVNRVSKPAYANSLLSNLIHELRNPLSAMKGYTELLPKHQELNSDGLMIHEQLTLAEDHMNSIVDNFVDFVKSGQTEVTKYCIGDVVKEAVSLSKSKIETHNVRVIIKADRLPLHSYIDPVKLRQVFINLISNSIDAFSVDKQFKTINIQLARNNNDETLIDIKDNGNGMTDRVKDNLFTPIKSDKQTGFGLGLTISKNILMAHGGNIELSESSRKGTHFVITMPTLVTDEGFDTSDKESLDDLSNV